MPRSTSGWTKPERRTTRTRRPRAGKSPTRLRTGFLSMRPTLLSSRAPRRLPYRTRSFRTGWTGSSGSSRPNAWPAGSTRWRLTRRCRRLLTTAAAPTVAWIATTAARPMSGPSRWSRSGTAVRSSSAPHSRGGQPETSSAPASCPAPSTARTRSPPETSPSGERPRPELRRDAHPAQLRRFDRPRDRPGFLRLLDEFADVGERGGAPFRQRDRHLGGGEAVLQHARAGKIVGESQQHIAVLRIDLRLALLDQVERGRLVIGLHDLSPLQLALQVERRGSAARRGDIDTGSVSLGHAPDRRARRDEVGEIDDDVWGREVEHAASRRIEGDHRDVPFAGLRVLDELRDRGVLDDPRGNARARRERASHRHRRSGHLPARLVARAENRVAGEDGDAQRSRRGKLESHPGHGRRGRARATRSEER